jgi:hypothetical protein
MQALSSSIFPPHSHIVSLESTTCSGKGQDPVLKPTNNPIDHKLPNGVSRPRHDPPWPLEPPRPGAPPRPGEPPRAGGLPDATAAVRAFNGANRAHEDLWSRVRHATDIVRPARRQAADTESLAAEADAAHRIIQAEHPDRRAPRVRQLLLAVLTIALDGLACNFAAQALGGGTRETLVWTALFLAVLAAGELALDVYQERQRRAVWRFLAGGLGAFVAMLGALRYSFLVTVGTAGPVTAVIGAALFTAATACLVLLGYRALRAAETAAAWKVRRRKLALERKALTARATVRAQIARRDRLADAYLSQLRTSLLQSCTASQLAAMEHAVRMHLVGGNER